MRKSIDVTRQIVALIVIFGFSTAVVVVLTTMCLIVFWDPPAGWCIGVVLCIMSVLIAFAIYFPLKGKLENNESYLLPLGKKMLFCGIFVVCSIALSTVLYLMVPSLDFVRNLGFGAGFCLIDIIILYFMLGFISKKLNEGFDSIDHDLNPNWVFKVLRFVGKSCAQNKNEG
ncbi:MAG TPA: hypothetical protein ENF20_02060 [Candidatus Marinimicrobia bacterium]|nr:hypothetical protein [Candidatus Neomarinimicrobiota bacterium]